MRRMLVLCIAWSFLWSVAGIAPSVHSQDKSDKAPLGIELPESDDQVPGAGPLRRADWFKRVWRDRRTTFAKTATQDREAVVFFGDSITQGWGDQFKDRFTGMKSANRGISGDTTRGMLLRLKPDVIDIQPKAVVMLMGTNDLEEQAEPAVIAENVQRIVQELKSSNPKLPIILCLVFPSSESKRRPASKIKELNERYMALAKGDSQITVLDTWTLFANDQGDAKVEEFPDLLHPNDVGYQKWAAALRPVLATLEFLETEPDSFTPEPGFVSLFNGRDLTGWGFLPTGNANAKKPANPQAPVVPVVTEAMTFDGKTSSDDGRYVAKNGRLIVTTPTEGRRIQQLWTTQSFGKDFVLKLEFRATPNADSGVFIRKPQLQCRDYPLAGPYKALKQYKPQDWNELVVTVRGGVAHCTCNGEVLEEAMQVPETGPIGLEGDRGQMEYRRIRISMP